MTFIKADPESIAARTELELAAGEDLYVGCGFHGMSLSQCPCPKGESSWLEYRALWVAARRELEAAKAHPTSLLGLIDQGQAQIVLLALAELELRRPGWHYAIAEIAILVGGTAAQQMVQEFAKTSADTIKSFAALRDEFVERSFVPEFDRTKLLELIDRLGAILDLNPMEAKFRGG